MSKKKILWFMDWQGSKGPEFSKVSENSEFRWEAASQWQDAIDKMKWAAEQKAPYAVAFVDSFEKAEWIWKIDSNVQCVIWADSNWDWAQNFKKFGQSDKWLVMKKPFTQWEAWQSAKTMWRKWELEKAAFGSSTPDTQQRKILVVDDEKQIREIVVEMLSEAGFKCFSAANGEEALKYFEDPSFKVDLLLTDIVMPKVTGIRLAETLTEQRHSIPVVFMSGFPRDVQFQKDVENGEKLFLQKPFSNDFLLRAIQNAFAGDFVYANKPSTQNWQA
jgi:CheY-like chemotaxis protein